MEVAQTLEDRMVSIEGILKSVNVEIKSIRQDLENVKKSIPDTDGVDPMDEAVERAEPLLMEKYRAKFVGLTYDGEVIDSADSEYKMIKKLQKSGVPNEQCFIYEVPER